MGGQFLRSCLVKGGGWCTLEQRCVEDDVAHCPAEPPAGSDGYPEWGKSMKRTGGINYHQVKCALAGGHPTFGHLG